MPDRLPPAPSARELATLHTFISPEARGFVGLPPFEWWKPLQRLAFDNARRRARSSNELVREWAAQWRAIETEKQ